MEPVESRPHPTIRLSDVHKTYILGRRRVEALRGATLQVHGPGFFAIMGASGSGKSTLLHLMAGLDRPDAGAIEVGGLRIDQLDEARLTRYRRREIGIVFQQFNLISTLNALENVCLPALLDGVPRRIRRARGCELLEALGLPHRADHRPDALSGGEQQRVAIARALMFEPKVLFADEPTGNLDSSTSEQLWSLLADLAIRRRMTILMVTHETSAAARCQRVFVLRDGRVTGDLTVEGLDASELATRAGRLVG